MRLFIYIFLLITLFGCGGSSEKEVELIPKDKFIEVLVDVHLGDAYLSAVKYDHNDEMYIPENFYPNVLEKHGVSREQFDKTLMYYAEDQKQLIKIYDQVLNKLSEKQASATQERQNNPEPVKDTTAIDSTQVK